MRPFGWQGIALSLPPAWELGAYDGDFRSGYARLDDGIQVRLHIQWKNERRPVDGLESILERYRKALTRKLNHAVEFQTFPPDAVGGPTDGKRRLAYSWTGKHAVAGCVSFCPECNRVTFAELFAGTQKAALKLAQDTLPSLTDHGQEGQLLWSVYGFGFPAPAAYTLVLPTLQPGRLQFSFRANRGRWLRVERWTLASPALETLPLEAWPRELLAAARLQPRGEAETRVEKVGALDACSFETTVSQGLLRRTEVRGLVWKSAEQRKVFAVVVGREPMDFVRGVAEGTRCY